MRVGRIATRIYPDIGGPAKQVKCLSEELAKIGYQNVIITATGRRKGVIDGNSVLCQIPIQTVSMRSSLLRVLFSCSFLFLGAVVSLFAFTKHRVNVIHTHSPPITLIIGYFLKKILRVPLVYTIHGMERWSSRGEEKANLMTKLEESIIRLADFIITVSPKYTNYLREKYGCREIRTIGNGVDTEAFAPKSQSPYLAPDVSIPQKQMQPVRLVSVGNLYLPEKVLGVETLLEALSLIKNIELPSYQLYIVGEGFEKERLKQKSIDLGISHAVTFLGHRYDVEQILQSCDIFIIPSLNEGSPNSLLEALSCGLCCVATSVGNIPQIMDGVGLLVGPRQASELARIIKTLLECPNMIQEYKSRARKRAVESLSWKAIAEKTKEIYVYLYNLDSA